MSIANDAKSKEATSLVVEMLSPVKGKMSLMGGTTTPNGRPECRPSWACNMGQWQGSCSTGCPMLSLSWVPKTSLNLVTHHVWKG